GGTFVPLFGEVAEGCFADPGPGGEIFRGHGGLAGQARRRCGPVWLAGSHSARRSLRLNVMPPIRALATPMATMTPSAAQCGGTAGADAIWWKTEVSRTQWLTAPIPPITTTSTDQPSTA